MTASTPYVSEKGVSPIELLGVVLEVHKMLDSSSTYLPFAFSRRFFIPSSNVLLEDSACPFP